MCLLYLCKLFAGNKICIIISIIPCSFFLSCFYQDAAGVITDFCSFYHLPSSITGNEKHNRLNAIYSYYNVATSVPLLNLMRDALILARDVGADVFNALDVMENEMFLEPLKFGVGDGHLQYYLYNWKCPIVKPNEIGLVLL